MSRYFSQEGLEKIKKELENRKNTVRPEINKKILAARELGDLSENAEYTEAKEQQMFNEGRIVELEEMIKEATVVSNQSQNIVAIGSKVKLESSRGTQEFMIVGLSESNPAEGFISHESPIGKALLGHKKEDTIEIKTPGGMITYTILDIK